MYSILKYRFPNGEVISQEGSFVEVPNPNEFDGFVVSNFEGNQFYGFLPNENREQQLEITQPIVLSQTAYIDLANEFIHYLQDHQIGKAILSRTKRAEFNSNSMDTLFKVLCEKYPLAFCYYFESPSLGNWIGATPETLIQVKDGVGQTMSLAGTKPSSDESEWGEKEKHEQQLVTDFIFNQLKDIVTDLVVSDRSELIAGPVKHLIHRFQFSVKETQQWSVIKRLHPTPAVSGFPRNEALRCIHSFEPHDRKFYAGIIGVQSPKNSWLFVNLRCAEVVNNQIFAYVGGGLTQQSVAEDEWTETENKAKTLLSLI